MNATMHPFADGLDHGLLHGQRCEACGRVQTHQRLACAHCGHSDLAWHDAGGHGTVVAASVVQRAPSNASRPLVPCTLVLVDLDDGPRVVGCATPGTAVGDQVQAGRLAQERRSLLRFSPTLR